MQVKSESEVAQSCPTFSDPVDCSPLGSSIHGIFQARVLEWGCHCLLYLSITVALTLFTNCHLLGGGAYYDADQWLSGIANGR